MYDRLQETPVYKEMTRLATEKARAEALKEADEARKKDLREMLLTIVQARFPKLSRSAKRLASTIDHISTLQNLVLKISTASNLEEARQYLRDSSKENTHD